MSQLIYESPDGGDTVYQRAFGSHQRELLREGPMRRQLERRQLWQDIADAALTDSALNELLEPARSYYLLKYTK